MGDLKTSRKIAVEFTNSKTNGNYDDLLTFLAAKGYNAVPDEVWDCVIDLVSLDYDKNDPYWKGFWESVDTDFKRCNGCGQFLDFTRHLEGITNRCDHCSQNLVGTLATVTEGWADTDAAWKKKANTILKRDGLRLASASNGEPGWYYTVVVDGEGVSVWVTDLDESNMREMAGDYADAVGIKKSAEGGWLFGVIDDDDGSFTQKGKETDRDLAVDSAKLLGQKNGLPYRGEVKEGKTKMNLQTLIQETIESVARGNNLTKAVRKLLTSVLEDKDIEVSDDQTTTPDEVLDTGSMTTDPQNVGGPSSPPQGEAEKAPLKANKPGDIVATPPGGAASKAPGAPTDGEENSYAESAFDRLYREAQGILNRIISEEDEDGKDEFTKKDTDKTKGKSDSDDDEDDTDDKPDDDDKDKKPSKDKDDDDDVNEGEDEPEDDNSSSKEVDEESDDDDKDEPKKKDESKKKKRTRESYEPINNELQIGEEVTYSGPESGIGGAKGRVLAQFPHSGGWFYDVAFEGVGVMMVPEGDLNRTGSGFWGK